MPTFIERVLRVLKLDSYIYKEVEIDQSATFQAVLVVILSSMAGGFGSIYKFGITGIFTGFIMCLAGWMVWTYLIYLIGTKIVPAADTQTNLVQLLRTAGFASAPGIFRLAGIVPLLDTFVWLSTSLWMLVTMIMATKHTLDYRKTVRAIIVCGLGFIVYVLVFIIFFLISDVV
jgi:hypothetical protein